MPSQLIIPGITENYCAERRIFIGSDKIDLGFLILLYTGSFNIRSLYCVLTGH